MTQKLIIHVDDVEHEITIGPARKADSIRRGELMLTATQMEDTETNKQVAFFLYPTCVCSVREPEDIKYMSFEDFLNKVDEADVDLWIEAAYSQNPQWRTALEALSKLGSEDSEKKTGEQWSGSSESTEEAQTTPEPETSPTPTP